MEATYILRLAFKELKTQFKNNVKSQTENSNSLMLIILIIFICAICLGFSVLFLPWIKNLRDEVRQNSFLILIMNFSFLKLLN